MKRICVKKLTLKENIAERILDSKFIDAHLDHAFFRWITNRAIDSFLIVAEKYHPSWDVSHIDCSTIPGCIVFEEAEGELTDE